LALLLFTCCKSGLSEEQIAGLTQQVDDNRTFNEGLNANLIARVSEALGVLAPNGECPENVLRIGTMTINRGDWLNILQTTRDELAGSVARRLHKWRIEGERLHRRLELTRTGAEPDPRSTETRIRPEHFDTQAQAAAERATIEWWPYEVVIVEVQRVAAMATGEGFTPGYIRAMAFVYDYGTESIACRATIEARSEEAEWVREDGDAASQLMGNLSSRLDELAVEALALSPTE